MSKPVKLSDAVVTKLDEMRHPGQSYDGVVREILARAGKAIDAEKGRNKPCRSNL